MAGSMIETVQRLYGASGHNLFGQTELSPVLILDASVGLPDERWWPPSGCARDCWMPSPS